MPSSNYFQQGAPWKEWGCDVLGPFPRTERVNHYILTGMDYITKWPKAYSLPDQEADMSARGWHFELGE